jgi:hypothetical protein
MALQASVGFQIPTNVVEVGNEITTDQLAAITSAPNSPSTANPFATNSFVTGQGYVTSSGLNTDQVYAIALTSNISSFTWSGSFWSGTIDTETPYFSANKTGLFKFQLNGYYTFTPTWVGSAFTLSGQSDDLMYTTTGTGESFTVTWNGWLVAIPVI